MREFRGDEFRGSEPVFGPLESEEKTPPFELEMMEAALVVATGAAPDQAGRCPLQLTRVKAHGAGLCCARCRAGALAQRWLHGGLWQGLQAVHVEVLRLGQNEPTVAARQVVQTAAAAGVGRTPVLSPAPQGAWTQSCSRSASAWARCCSGCRATSRPSTWRSCAASSSRWSSWSPRPTRCGARGAPGARLCRLKPAVSDAGCAKAGGSRPAWCGAAGNPRRVCLRRQRPVCVLVGLAEQACGASLPLTPPVRRVPTGLQHACVTDDNTYIGLRPCTQCVRKSRLGSNEQQK